MHTDARRHIQFKWLRESGGIGNELNDLDGTANLQHAQNRHNELNHVGLV